MRETNFISRLAAVRKIKALWREVSELNIELSQYCAKNGIERYNFDEKATDLAQQINKRIYEAVDIEDSGMVPWLTDNGTGNSVDADSNATVWARRIFDQYAPRNHDVPDGRAIHLTVQAGGRGYSTMHTMKFHHPETVREVIDQLEEELRQWNDDWTGQGREIRGEV